MDLNFAEDNYPNPEETENQGTESDWYEYLSNPVVTLGAGMLCGIIANLLSRASVPARGAMQRLSSEDLGSSLFAGPSKMVLVVRTDIGMSKGKAAAQCAHAAVNCYKKAMKNRPDALSAWEKSGQAKVCVKVDSEEAMLNLAGVAKVHGLTWSIIQDAGRTQVNSGTMTVLGIGPGSAEQIDKITGHLKLY
eukprot:TRINITY_DN4233_c0_g1_i1.p1 TRINITY_DN4233_c0_g1~~TRINITY_DN4233_c0_g1_i1.p1  ORF type:complete len:192 (-),score=39.36 TRINITY_DN4233_c0_g1_i1:527-1102(-)